MTEVGDVASAPALPAAPSGLTAAAITNSRIDLAWTDNSSDESGFTIERKTGAAGTFVQIATIGANVISFTNGSLSPGTVYFYRVRAYNNDGNSAYSNEASATTLPKPPGAPSGLTAIAVSKSQINLAWADTATNETGFRIERKIGAAGTYTQIATVGANITSFSNTTGLVPNTAYFYRVRANNTGGNSDYSNEANATTLPNPPKAPGNLTATAISSSQINLTWADSSDNEDGFKIERKTGEAGTYAEIATVGANVTSYADAGLTATTAYFYRVRANNTGGNSAYSTAASATTLSNAPTAPSGLTATAMTSARIDLAWTDNSSDESGFRIERKTGAAGTYVQIATVGANVMSFTNGSLSSNTMYFYRVRAYKTGSNSDYSNEASATTLPSAPSAPSGLTATATSNTRIDLVWTDNSNNEDGFKIEIKAGPSGTFTEIAVVGANATSYASTGLEASTQYFYRVRAYNAQGHSAYSNAANVTTLSDPPATPNSLTTAVVSNTQINLTWTDNATNEDGFKIECKLNSAVTYTEIATVAANVTAYSSMGLSPNTAYSYRIRAYNAGGNSAYSNVAGATTLPNPPNAPSGLTATAASNNQINLAWQDNANNELGFIIERKTGVAGAFAAIDTVNANVKTYASLGLAGSTQYFYQVRAYNAGGNSAYSNAANATTLIDPPTAPSNLVATPISNQQINLTWTDNAGSENGFRIELKIAPSGTYAQIATVGANAVSYSSKGLNASTQYFYRVRAFNGTGNSGYSNEANATTNPDPPTAPSGLQAVAVSNVQITLTWTDNAADENGFKIERKLSSAATYTQIATVGANVTTFLSTGLNTNTAYSYRVRAYNQNGNSAYSNEASATTLPNSPTAPGGLVATTISKSQINLVWADSSTTEDGFKIERKLNSMVEYTEIATVAANVMAYSSMGLSPNTAYSYRIRAYNTGGNSAYSNVAGATTLPNPPNAPSGLTATAVSNTRINLAWQDNANNELGVIIERKTGADGAYAAIDTVNTNVKTYASLGLAGSTQYFYQVRAYNAGGNSAYSNAANATTLIDPPAAPSNLVATAVSNGQINLTWTDNAGSENGFTIELKVGPSGTYAQIATVGANVTTYASTGLDATTQYFYRMRAFNSTGNSSYSNTASAITRPDPPAAPSGLQATTKSSAKIDLMWTDNSTNEDGFKIERKLSSAAIYTQIATVGANVTIYASTGLTQNTAYSYRVRAFNTGGNSLYSNAAVDTTLPKPPGAPSGLTATAVSGSQINLAWADTSNNETMFKIERKTGAAGTYSQIATVGANITSFSNTTGLNPNTQYFYRVRAYNIGGNSGYSNEANATTSGGAKVALDSDAEAAASALNIPETITLAPNYPNPFSSEARSLHAGNPGTMISFTLPATAKVTLQIYTETGQLVRTLVDGDLPPGHQRMRWNGRNESGRVAAAGVYLYRLLVQASNGEILFTQSRPMTMLK